VPKFYKNRCTNCGICASACAFNALIKAKEHVLVYKNLCHSCNACAKLCPEEALVMEGSRIGDVRIFESKLKLTLVDGILDLKEEMSTPLIEAVKKKANEMAEESDFVIFDSPPGTSCSYLESIKDSDLVLIITEPTPFGRSDSGLAIDTAKKMKKKIAVIINRSKEDESETEDFFSKRNVPVISLIRDNIDIAKNYSNGETIFGKFGDFDRALKDISGYITKESEL
ncbi:MAG: AAA family ATPase, partial [bacterium]|nr:AAA family ATPase [bacterium]